MTYPKFNAYIRLMRLNKPIGIFLLLWPTLMALWIAGNGKPDAFISSIFIAGVIVMRSAGCVINDLADKEFDKSVARTKMRPLATGELTPKEAIQLFIFLILLALILVMQLNMLTIAMSIVALFLAMIYPFMKRYTAMPQIVLGAAFGWAVPMAFTAVNGQITPVTWLLYISTLLWALVYDTQYAMVDKEDDIKIGLNSTAILFGQWDRIVIGVLQLAVLALFTLLGYLLKFGKIYYLCLLMASVLALYQQYLIKDRLAPQCFKAFLNNNIFGGMIFLGVVFEYRSLNLPS